jgi:hypothetical protein
MKRIIPYIKLPEDEHKAGQWLHAIQSKEVYWGDLKRAVSAIDCTTYMNLHKYTQIIMRASPDFYLPPSFVAIKKENLFYLDGNLLCNSPQHFALMVKKFHSDYKKPNNLAFPQVP